MLRFIKNISIFSTIFIVLYFVFFNFVDMGLKQSEHLEFEQWNSIYNGNINSDIIIQGSSRAWRQIDPKEIEKQTGLTVYNLGMDGYHFPMQKCRLDIYLKENKKPKYIIQILDHFTLLKRDNLFNKSQFIPYLNDSILTNQLKQYEGFSWAAYNLPYFGYFGSKELAAAGLLEYFKIKKFNSRKYNGFKSKNKKWQNGFDLEKHKNKKGKRIDIRLDIFKQMDNFITNAKRENIEVILVYPPDYVEFQNFINNRDTIMTSYKILAKKHDLNFIDFSLDSSLCNNKSYFYNPTHLNSTGSELLSNKLALKLKELYKF